MDLEAPLHCAPRPPKKSGRRGQVKVSCQAEPSPRSPRTLSAGTRAAWLLGHGVSSQRESRAKAERAGRRLGRPLPPARRPRSRRWDRRGRAAPARLGLDPRAFARARRTGAEPPPRPQLLTVDAGYLSVRPGLGKPPAAPGGGGGGSGYSATSTPGSSREGSHFPPSFSPCWPRAPRSGSGAGSCPPPTPTAHPAPGFLLLATLPRNFPCFVLRLEMIYGSVLDRVSARRQEPSAEMCYVLIYPSIMDGNK